MKKIDVRRSLLMGLFGLSLLNTAQAGAPLWTFIPDPAHPPQVNINSSGNATIQYTVTNQSSKTHTLQMRPIQGIVPSGCTSPLTYHQSCTLSLNVTGSALTGDVIGGPVLCEQGKPLQCYQPSAANNLAIHLTQTPTQKYTVTPSAGINGSISPSTLQVVNSGSTITFTATPAAGYGVNQWLVDGNLAQTGGTTYQLTNITANHTVKVTFGTVTLTPSVSSLALSINCQPSSSCTTTKNAALTGNQRQITIQNTGSVSATQVSVSTSGLPSGTSILTNTCTGTLNPASSCTIILKPGAIASSDGSNTPCTSGKQPVAGTVTVTADGGLSSQVNVYVLSYGCQYQGGFLFAVDDTTVNTGSIGGKVVSLVDQAAPFLPSSTPPGPGSPWDADPACATGPSFQCTDSTGAWDFYFGQNLSSVPGSTNPNNTGTNGPGNTWQISSILNGNFGNTNTPPATYAAGVCISYNGASYSDWYLPAICEVDSVNGTNFTNCSSGTQSIVGSLAFLIGSESSPTPSTSCNPPTGTNCFCGNYWSSTEQSNTGSRLYAWQESFDSITSNPLGNSKEYHFGVRCVRDLT